MIYFEDLEPGKTTVVGSHTFTAEAIRAFATRFDPQPFHIDEAAGRETHFGGLVASGWHTASAYARLVALYLASRQEIRSEQVGEDPAPPGPSTGLEELRWIKPVRPGDTVTYSWEVLETRLSRSRPGWGVTRLRIHGVNQDGVEVITFVQTVLVATRDATSYSGAA
ncbi:MaoC family dehydratase [Amorphus orientalis]|uniref:Acyl dehydratase n=1 Tax=Amorphus orientalis TaxID=649198 RepID=A0AAE3VR56_9HYPH|nr:MaoC family dehydratase [Amorphus orientalis]MDQ0316670.1 acyl dehydratase [Amorphus orientalis]